MKRTAGAFLLTITFLVIPATAFAQESGLVPCGGEGNPCTFCHLFSLGNNIISFLLFPSPVNSGFAIVPLVATVLLAYGGLQFLLGSSGSPFGQGGFSVQKGLEAITATVVGLLIVYTSWILIETFLVFAGVSSWTGLGNWWEIECSTTDPVYVPPSNAPSKGRPMGSPVCSGGTITITTQFSSNHSGIDIGIPTGEPVRATAKGTVEFSGTDGGGGNQIKIRHENGWTTRYLHLSSLFVNKNDEIDQGEIIGRSGGDPSPSSEIAVNNWVNAGRPTNKGPVISNETAQSGAGWSTGAHLHYEALYNNEAQNINSGFGVCGNATCQENRTYSCSQN